MTYKTNDYGMMMTEEEFRDKFADNLKVLRKAKGLTQKELGLKCGFTPSSAERMIRKWESKTQTPSTYFFKILCIALECRLSELMP